MYHGFRYTISSYTEIGSCRPSVSSFSQRTGRVYISLSKRQCHHILVVLNNNLMSFISQFPCVNAIKTRVVRSYLIQFLCSNSSLYFGFEFLTQCWFFFSMSAFFPSSHLHYIHSTHLLFLLPTKLLPPYLTRSSTFQKNTDQWMATLCRPGLVNHDRRNLSTLAILISSDMEVLQQDRLDQISFMEFRLILHICSPTLACFVISNYVPLLPLYYQFLALSMSIIQASCVF